MVVCPIGSYFLTLNTIFGGKRDGFGESEARADLSQATRHGQEPQLLSWQMLY